MITKFKKINNLAVFKNFDWDTEVRTKRENNIIILKKVNIFYGRNYAGKTTLSRLVRALETGKLSDKYENPECCICLEENTDVTQLNFSSHNKTIRVFNDDFIKENLRFIVNQDENIEPFAILGEGNNEIEEEIKILKTSLGLNEEENETGLYKDLKSLDALYIAANRTHADSKNSLKSQLNSKATSQPDGIKYQSEKYGEVNYDIRKLNSDIQSVKKGTYLPLDDKAKLEAENILKEQTKVKIEELVELNLDFFNLYSKTEEVVIREIGQSNKIEELTKDAVLNRWVKEGKRTHQGKLNICTFCNNAIDEDRWSELDKHFDEESEQLEKDIKALLDLIKLEKTNLSKNFSLKQDQVYSKFHADLKSTNASFENEIKNYYASLVHLESQLNIRKKDVLNKQSFIEVKNFSSLVEEAKEKLEEVRSNSNKYSDKLNTDQLEAKNNLRLREVYDFVNDIKYDDLVANILSLKIKEDTERVKKDTKQTIVDELIAEISAKQRQLKDESKGADKVNEFLNNYFGHDFLSLKAIEFVDKQTGIKSYRFEIHRERKKAYHLSEGEKSLISFCYFVAKLQDIDTKSKKPIIWIDDPISSLDNNHIFFIYSLIKTKIYNNGDFEQLFLSTHNLNFLKYLQRLPSNSDRKKDRVRHFLIERRDKVSVINEMPDYIKKNITEFNHLFKQIAECSRLEHITDENFSIFYNFGNNARKFLEIYLFYKYPDSTDDMSKMKKFFGDEDIPAVLTSRINNEYSHIAGVFERGQLPVEEPEMKKSAQLIVNRIKELDKDQYNALLASVGLKDLVD